MAGSMSSEARGPEEGGGLECRPRETSEAGQTEDPTTLPPFPLHLQAAWREEVRSHLDTNRATKALSCPPAPPSPPYPQPTVGGLFWGREPRRPCSLGAQTQAGRVKREGVPRPPCSVPHPVQDQPPHSSPGASAVPATEDTPAAPRSTSQAGSRGWCLHHGPTWPHLHPGPWSHEERIKGGGWSKAGGDSQSCKITGGPATSHRAPCPRESPGWGARQTQSAPQPALGGLALRLGVLCALASSSYGCCHQDGHRGG